MYSCFSLLANGICNERLLPPEACVLSLTPEGLILVIFMPVCQFDCIRVSTGRSNLLVISRSFFAKLFCYSFASAIFFYISVNMSMVLGLLPIVGSPLPIMSYGGSSMLATMIGFSVVMSAKIYHRQLIP